MNSLYILHLETSTKVCSVALSNQGELIDYIDIEESNFIHGEKLNLLIEQIIQRNNITLKDLVSISTSDGPGSYTGLRIGASTAKALCYTLKIPLIAISSLENLAQQVINQKKYNLIPMIDARRMEVFSAVYDKEFNLIKDTDAIILDELSFHEYEPFVYFGDGAEKLETLWKNKNCLYEHIKSSAKGHVKIAHNKYINKTYSDIAYFEPNYLKQNF